LRRGNLLIVSGPSGAGKGTLVEALRDRVPDLWVSVSATTRPPRPGEEEGVHYIFLSPEEFERRVQRNEFLEHATVHGNRYGTLRRPVERGIAEGKQVVLEIDVQGALQVKDAMPRSILVFIVAPTMDELKRRLLGRGSETDDEVESRMTTAQREVALVDTYDHVVENDDVRRATDELVSIIDNAAGEKD
jgi:guanylate kinase